MTDGERIQSSDVAEAEVTVAEADDTGNGESQDLPTYTDATLDGVLVPLLHSEKDNVPGPQPVEPPKYTPREPTEAPLTNDYSTGLFECHKDLGTAAMATAFPCLTFGMISSKLSANSMRDLETGEQARETTWKEQLLHSVPYTLLAFCAPHGCTSVAGMFQRYNIQNEYEMEPRPIRDIFAHLCCHCCAMAQDHREVNIREEQRRVAFNQSQQNSADYL